MRNLKIWTSVLALLIATAVLTVDVALRAATPSAAQGDKPVAEKKRLPVETAKVRAALMHDIYSATLDTMHHHYFHGDRAIVPARAMEDIFAELNRQTDIEARWIAVNTKAMSIDHEPENAFEKQAAKEIADGKDAVELIKDGVYHRAGAIPLAQGCVSCHMGTFAPPSKVKRFAALVIRIPVEKE